MVGDEAKAKGVRKTTNRRARKLLEPLHSAVERLRHVKESDWSQLGALLEKTSCPKTLHALIEAVAALLGPGLRLATATAGLAVEADLPLGLVDRVTVLRGWIRGGESKLIYEAVFSIDLESMPDDTLKALAPTLSDPNLSGQAMQRHSLAAM